WRSSRSASQGGSSCRRAVMVIGLLLRLSTAFDGFRIVGDTSGSVLRPVPGACVPRPDHRTLVSWVGNGGTRCSCDEAVVDAGDTPAVTDPNEMERASGGRQRIASRGAVDV